MFQHPLDPLRFLNDLLDGFVRIGHAVHAALTDSRPQVAAVDVRVDHRQKLLESSLGLVWVWLLVLQVLLDLSFLDFLLNLLFLLLHLLLLILGEFVLLTIIVELLRLALDHALLLFSEDLEGFGEA